MYSSKPPLAMSTRRTRTRRDLSPEKSIRTPLTKTSGQKNQTPIRSLSIVSRSPSEPQSMSYKFRILTKMVEEQFGKDALKKSFDNDFTMESVGPVFEKGRFYEEYCARRNERLKRKKREIIQEKPVRESSTIPESGKKRVSKEVEMLRKSVPANFLVCESERTRSSVRSSLISNKENMKPVSCRTPQSSAINGTKRIGTRSSLKF